MIEALEALEAYEKSKQAQASKPPPPPPTAPEPPARAGSRATLARMLFAKGDRVQALKYASSGQSSGQVSAGGTWCEATIIDVGASGNLHIHYFGWKAESHNEWIKAEVKGSRLRVGTSCLKHLIHSVPESERDADDEASVALLVEGTAAAGQARPLPSLSPSTQAGIC